MAGGDVPIMAGGDAPTGETRKTISPYDITSLDNPGLSITQVQLKGIIMKNGLVRFERP